MSSSKLTLHTSLADLHSHGAIVDVRIVPRKEAVAYLPPAAKRAERTRLLLDTGAQSTLVVPSVLRSLGIPAARTANVLGVSGHEKVCLAYAVLIEIQVSNSAGARSWAQVKCTAVESPREFKGEPYEGLLGRDFLRSVRLTYDGPTGTIDLEVRE